MNVKAALAKLNPLGADSVRVIAIPVPTHRQRALAIGEALGIDRDVPVSKGCTSPFAPIWINAMVRRQG
jgi:hypothetical protein